MVLKLYKQVAGAFLYWEGWDHDGTVTIHWGQVGDRGNNRDYRAQPREDPETVIDREARAPRADGYEEIPIESHAQLIVQYRLAGWGGVDDLQKRERVEDALNDCLGWTGNGYCDGGDIGSGTINAFSFVIDPILATHSIVTALRACNLLDGAIIAVETEQGFNVLWPADFDGEFDYF